MKRKLILLILLWLLLTFMALANPPFTLKSVADDVYNSAGDIARIFVGVIGFIGFGIAAFQFVSQNMGSLKGLLFAICGYGVANIAVSLL
jgi:hypothetical protein